MLLGIEYQNWYQILRPYGSNVFDEPRVEVLKLPNEADIRLRDKVPWGLARRGESVSAVIANQLETSQSLQRMNVQSSKIISHLSLKSTDEITPLSPRREDFLDQNKEIEEIFWKHFNTVNPTCPDDVDIEEITKVLAERRMILGRDEQTSLDEKNRCNNYRFGQNAKRPTSTEDQILGAQEASENLLQMIERMVAERTKPPPVSEDLYDKNNPIKGKVGFRRDPNGPRCFTNYEEQLNFGDLENDTNFYRFLVETGRGRFDSQGNFIALDADGKEIRHVSQEDILDNYNMRPQKNEKQRKGRPTGGLSSSNSQKKQFGVRNESRSTRREGTLRDIMKQRRYPEWEFPLCNYPKWVHRMYRMDQVKIGQLIKQGMDVHEYDPPWVGGVPGKVLRTENVPSKGLQTPEQGRNGIEGGDFLNEDDHRGETGNVAGTSMIAPANVGWPNGKTVVGEGIESNRKDGELGNESATYDGLVVENGLDGGMADFLQEYEKEIIDQPFETTDSNQQLRRGGEMFHIDDLIVEYEKELRKQERELLDERLKNQSHLKAEKLQKLNERREAALKRIGEQIEKKRQEQSMKEEVELVPEILEREHSILQTKLGKKYRHPKKDKLERSSPTTMERCREFTTMAADASKDAECMRRFKILLGRGNARVSEDNFFELLRREIPLFTYEPVTSYKKTPCERVKIPIC